MTKAVIAGGGIAGAITAVALAKAGIESEILERYDRTAEGAGLFLTLGVNGIDALGVVGLGDVVGDLGFETRSTRLVNHRGRVLGEFAMGGPLADGTVCRTVWRSDLYVALRDAAVAAGARIRYGSEVTSAVESADGVRVGLADGGSVEGDLLVGADGLRSRVRTIIDPAAPKATYQGLLNTGGVARGIEVDAPIGAMQMMFGRHCFLGYVVAPDRSVWWFANPVERTELDPAQLRARAAGFRDELRGLLAEPGTPGAAIVDATETIMPPWNTYYFPTVPTWHTDRMLIIGDAAHAVSPASGQGASMAIEDAVVLGRCLRDAGDIPSALRTYEQQRRARVEAVVKVGKRNGSGKAAGPVGRVVRDAFLSMYLKRAATSGKDPQRWIWEHHIDWDATVRA
jgi:FAD-dependent urate hydroxylase